MPLLQPKSIRNLCANPCINLLRRSKFLSSISASSSNLVVSHSLVCLFIDSNFHLSLDLSSCRLRSVHRNSCPPPSPYSSLYSSQSPISVVSPTSSSLSQRFSFLLIAHRVCNSSNFVFSIHRRLCFRPSSASSNL